MARREFFSSRFHYSFGPHAPTLRIASGEALRVICPDSDNALSDGTLLTASQRHVDSSCILEGNPLAGPIWHRRCNARRLHCGPHRRYSP